MRERLAERIEVMRGPLTRMMKRTTRRSPRMNRMWSLRPHHPKNPVRQHYLGAYACGLCDAQGPWP